MKLKWYGHSCFAMTFENGTVLITDPFDGSMQYPLCTARADIALVSHDHFDHNHVSSLSGNPAVIKTAGTHFANGIKITCVPSFHDAERGAKRGENLISIIEADASGDSESRSDADSDRRLFHDRHESGDRDHSQGESSLRNCDALQKRLLRFPDQR